MQNCRLRSEGSIPTVRAFGAARSIRREVANGKRKTNCKQKKKPVRKCERVSTLNGVSRRKDCARSGEHQRTITIIPSFFGLCVHPRGACCVTGFVSRVLCVVNYAAVIYLRRLLPNGLRACALCRHRDSGGNRSGFLRSPEGVASDRVYRKPALPQVSVSSYLAFPPLPPEGGGISLLHFPWGRPRRTLSVILPCEARTFLTVIPFGAIPRDRATR